MRIELSEAAARGESMAAQRLIDDFLVAVEQRGIAPVPLRVTLFNGRSARTDRQGWYLRRNRSVAIGSDGGYYVLAVPGGIAEQVRGVRLQRTPPPLVVGRGAKDGEGGDLRDFLELVLERGTAD